LQNNLVLSLLTQHRNPLRDFRHLPSNNTDTNNNTSNNNHH
jgi:hypothetical protein